MARPRIKIVILVASTNPIKAKIAKTLNPVYKAQDNGLNVTKCNYLYPSK
jgi:hypothetical protein